MSGGPDALTLLERALIRDAAARGLAVTIPASESSRWASATFVGARHLLTLVVTSEGADWLGSLSEADLPLRDHLLAEIEIVRQQRADEVITATIEALTVEER